MERKNEYAKNFEELKQIIEEIERKIITVDELPDKIRRAANIIANCKTAINATDDANSIARELENKKQ